MSYIIAMPIGVGVLIFSFLFIATQLEKKHGMLKMMFFVLSLVFAVMDVWLMARSAEMVGMIEMSTVIYSAMTGLTYILLLVIFYFILDFLNDTFDILSRLGAKRKWRH